MFRLFISDMVGKPTETKSGKKTEAAPPPRPPTEGESILVFFEFFLTSGLQSVDIYDILKE